MTFDVLLCNKYSVSQDDIDKAVAFQRKFGGRVEKILVNMGVLSEDSLPELYAEFLALPRATNEMVDNWSLNGFFASTVAEKLMSLNWFIADGNNEVCTILVEDPLLPDANQIASEISENIVLYILDEIQLKEIKQSVLELGPNNESGDDLSELEEDRLRELAGEAPTVNLLNGLIGRALKIGASDMHLEPVGDKYRVRYRVDGVLQEGELMPYRMKLPIASRIKVLSNMDIAEKRRPQDGKIAMKIANENLDIRVSSLPLNDGESIVMRFLRQEAIKYDMEALGLAKDVEAKIRDDLAKTSGVVLLTGPTGSGKTTSLYTFLDVINDDSVKIITLEDPVEYQLNGVNQVQVQAEIGFDFASGLRSIVRQDPDIIMLGEIRDAETAHVAMQSALTGHLVFSTVHTNDAPSAYTRLIDLGVEEFLLNAALVSIIAQRLVRKLCPECSRRASDSADIVKKYSLDVLAKQYGFELSIKEPVGCNSCNHTGYKGRMAIVEYLNCDEEINKLSKDQYFVSNAKALMKENGNRTLMEDGMYKVIRGLTSIDEVMRVAG